MSYNSHQSVKETMEEVASSTHRTHLKHWISGAVLILLIIVAFAVLTPGGSANIPQFQTRPVQRGDLLLTVSATGNLAARNEVSVGSELSGIITAMTVDYNDSVTANQPLAYLDDTKYKAAVVKSKAEVAAAKAGYQEALATRNAAEKTLKRYRKTRELTNGKLPSLTDLEQAEADMERAVAALASAEASIQIAEASLASNEVDLKKTIIYSPINGIVLSRDVESGQTVAASLEAPVLYTLAEDLGRMELEVDIDEADVGQIREGQSATFTVDAYPDRSFEAVITQVRYNAETTDGVVTYKSVLHVENADLMLRPGMTATTTITVRKVENALLVPNTALRFSPPRPSEDVKEKRGLIGSLMPGPPHMKTKKTNGEATSPGPTGMPGADMKSCVWVLKDGRPMPVPVEKGDTDGMVTVVTSKDLTEGSEVITSSIVAGNE